MQLFPVIAIILPSLGAVGTLGMSGMTRVRPYTRYVALAAVGLTSVLTLAFRWLPPGMVVASLWQPSVLFGVPLALQVDGVMQPLAFALALVTWSAILVDLGGNDAPSPRLLAIVQALLAAGLLALWSANSLTTLIGWAIYDLVQTAGRMEAGVSAREAVRSLVLGSVATLLLWSGTFLSDGGAGSELWSLMTISDVQMSLWVVAGVLRLWAYPFHVVVPEGGAASLATPLSLSPVLGWGLWLQLALANNGSIPGGGWLLVLAAVNLGMGSFLSWCCESPRRTLSWVGVGTTGSLLLAAGLAGGSAAGVVAVGSVAWALGMGAMFLSDGLRRDAPWWSIPATLGALTLLGLPLTLGFVTGASLIGGITKSGSPGWGSAFFFGNLLLVPSVVRGLLATPSSPWPAHRWPSVVRGIGLGLPALVLIVAGLYPSFLGDAVALPSVGQLFAMPGLAGWLLWVVSLAGGAVLAWQDEALCPKISLWLSATHDLLSLEWLYRAVAGALERGFSALRAADKVVRGGGALLWSWLLFLLLLLVWGSM